MSDYKAAHPKPGKKPSYASRKATHMREFEANSHLAWKRDGRRCRYCRELVPEGKPAHHIQGAGLGGWRNNAVSNLATAHDKCHNEQHGIKEGN